MPSFPASCGGCSSSQLLTAEKRTDRSRICSGSQPISPATAAISDTALICRETNEATAEANRSGSPGLRVPLRMRKIVEAS